MKSLRTLALALLMFSFGVLHAQEATRKLTLDFDLSKDSLPNEFKSREINKKKTDYLKQMMHVGYNTEVTVSFRNIEPGYTMTRSPYDAFPAVIAATNNVITEQFTLSQGQEITYRLMDATGEHCWEYSFLTKPDPKNMGNPSYLFVSAIRSIGSEQYDNQFVDLNLKTNLLGGKYFAAVSADLNIKQNETDSSAVDLNATGLVEAAASFNTFFRRKDTPQLLQTYLARSAYVTGGIKVFNSQAYYGAGFGIAEVNGPLFTSYAQISYLRNFYDLPDMLYREGDFNLFRNNIYIESAFMIDAEGNDNEFVQTLNRIRVKIGVLFPMGEQRFITIPDDETTPDTNEQKAENKKVSNGDIQYRLVLELPLGKIFRF